MKLILAAAGLAIGTATAANAETRFIETAIHGDYAETKMGMLAEKKGSTPAVRAYGKMLADDHSKHRNKAAALARKIGVKPPEGPDLKQRASYAAMSLRSGRDFDDAFKKYMIDDHKTDIANYEAEAKDGDPRLRAFAKTTIPTLKKHLETAEAL